MKDDRRKPRSPYHEKQRDLARRSFKAEYPHGFRKSWPRKKARISRAHRRTVRQATRDSIGLTIDDGFDLPAIGLRKRPPLKKWMSDEPSLRERIACQRSRRYRRLAWNYFKDPYSSARHRERFAGVVRALIVGDPANMPEYAARVRRWFSTDPSALPRFGFGLGTLGGGMHWIEWNVGTWLEAFGRDEPELHAQLRAWAFGDEADE